MILFDEYVVFAHKYARLKQDSGRITTQIKFPKPLKLDSKLTKILSNQLKILPNYVI